MSSAVRGDPSFRGNAFQAHPLRDAAGSLGAMSPQAYMRVVAAAQQQFLEGMSQVAAQQCGASSRAVYAAGLTDMPCLKSPSQNRAEAAANIDLDMAPPDGRMVAGAAGLTELLGKLRDIIGGNRIEQLKQRADIWNRLSKAMQAELNALSSELDRATAEAAARMQAATNAQQNAADAASVEKTTGQDLVSAQSALDDASGRNPVDREKIESLQRDLGIKAEAALNARTKAWSSKVKAATEMERAIEAAARAWSVEQQANAAQVRAIQQFGQNSPMRPVPTARLTGSAELTAVLGKLQMLISSCNVDELESKQKLFDEMQKSREADLRRKSEEYQQEVRKAEELQKTMGCIGKIVGWIVTVTSFAAAAVTGGASLALAAVGLALAVGDQICQAATGVSFMDKIMQPVMDHVLKPLMNFISSLITKALIECGVERQAAELAGAILGAVLSGVALVVAAFVGASILRRVAVRVLQSLVKPLGGLMEKSIGRILAQLAEKSGLTGLSARTASAMGRLRKAMGMEATEDALLRLNQAEKVGAGLNVANHVMLATGDIVAGGKRCQAMNLLADVKVAMYDAQVIGDLLRQAVDTFAEHNKVLAKLMKNMSDAGEVETSTGKFVLRNIRAI